MYFLKVYYLLIRSNIDISTPCTGKVYIDMYNKCTFLKVYYLLIRSNINISTPCTGKVYINMYNKCTTSLYSTSY